MLVLYFHIILHVDFHFIPDWGAYLYILSLLYTQGFDAHFVKKKTEELFLFHVVKLRELLCDFLSI